MSGKIFVDTNILVYAHDLDAGEKHETAKEIIIQLWESRSALISTQVLQELYVTLTRKIPQPLDGSMVRRILSSYLSWEIIVNEPEIILQAGEIEESYMISFWDALIVAAAFSGNASTLFTEDLNHGQYIEGVLIKNPFMSRDLNNQRPSGNR
jgi:predicted nucleic acid-binding protein